MVPQLQYTAGVTQCDVGHITGVTCLCSGVKRRILSNLHGCKMLCAGQCLLHCSECLS